MYRPKDLPGYDNSPRGLLDRAKQEGNEILAANVDLDLKIERLIRYGLDAKTVPDLSEVIDTLGAHTFKVLIKNEYSGSGTWNDYYRLLSHHELTAEIVYAPILFDRGSDGERLRLVDGTYGVNARILEGALEQYDHPDASSQEREQLQGAIHEQTAMALINHAQSPNNLALPSTAQDDIHQKTDIIYHRVRRRKYDIVKIQVKSTPPKDLRHATPQGGILVLARDMGNSHNFETARAIVRQSHGTDTDNERRHLTVFVTHFNNLVDAKQVESAA